MVALTKFSFWDKDWAPGYKSMTFVDFLDNSSFPKIITLNLIRPYHFFNLTCTNVGLSSQNYLTFGLKHFATLVNFSTLQCHTQRQSQIINLEPNTILKIFFLVKTFSNCCYDNFTHTNIRFTKHESHSHICMIIRVTWYVIPSKLQPHLLKIPLTQKKLQELDVLNCNFYLYFFIYENPLTSDEKMLMSAELMCCITWFMYFLECSLGKVQQCFIIVS